jgi:transposase
MLPIETYTNERLDHLGIVACICQEIGLARYLDVQAGNRQRQVSIGTATVAMTLNGLGWSFRRSYLVPQFIANKPVEHSPGQGLLLRYPTIIVWDIHWIGSMKTTRQRCLQASLSRRAKCSGSEHVYVATTSFSVSGDYTGAKEAGEFDVSTIAITYSYSRDHRADLKQWMLALAISHEGDVPLDLAPAGWQ